MRWPGAKIKQRITPAKWVLLAVLVAAIGGSAWIFLGRPFLQGLFVPRLTEFPKPPVPKAFPKCPESITQAHEWRGVSFEYPHGWFVEEDSQNKPGADGQTLYILNKSRRDLRQYVESIMIMENQNRSSVIKVVEAAWALPEGERLDPTRFDILGEKVVPETIERLKIGGARAFQFMRRWRGLLPSEHDEWGLFIKTDEEAYWIGGGSMFHPYFLDGTKVVFNAKLQEENEAQACAYWMVVKSLKFP